MSYLVLLTLLLNLPLYAEDLETIEVKAEKRISRFTFNDSVVVPLEEKRDTTIVPLLENVPGTITAQDGGPGGRTSYFIRGTESRHVSFTLDGLRLNDPSNTDRQFDSAFFTSAFLSELQVNKGPQPVLYGSDAIGGLVEMRTRKGEKAPEARLDINAGSFGTIDTALGKDWKKSGHQGTLTLNRFHTDGISRLNHKRYKAKERDAADITQLTSSSKHEWHKKWESDLLVSYVHGKNELDGMTDDNHKDHSRNDQYILQQKTSHYLNKTSAISLRNGFNRHQREINTLAIGKDRYSGNYYQNELLYQTEFKNFSLLTGAASEKESLNLSRLDRSFELHSLFAQGIFKTKYLKLHGGGRLEHHTRYGEFKTGAAGVALYHQENEISFQYAQGFKAPSVYQLYGPSIFGFPVGNKNLVPERNHSMELSLKSKYSKLTFFQNRLKDLITYTNNGYRNQGDFITEGVEVSALLGNEKWQLTPSYLHQNFRSFEAPILRRPRNSAQTQLSFTPGKAEVFLRGKWFDARQDLSPTGARVKLSSYEVLDVGGKYHFSNQEVGVQVLNVFNREYENLYGYSVMPLSVFLHYGVRL